MLPVTDDGVTILCILTVVAWPIALPSILIGLLLSYSLFFIETVDDCIILFILTFVILVDWWWLSHLSEEWLLLVLLFGDGYYWADPVDQPDCVEVLFANWLFPAWRGWYYSMDVVILLVVIWLFNEAMTDWPVLGVVVLWPPRAMTQVTYSIFVIMPIYDDQCDPLPSWPIPAWLFVLFVEAMTYWLIYCPAYLMMMTLLTYWWRYVIDYLPVLLCIIILLFSLVWRPVVIGPWRWPFVWPGSCRPILFVTSNNDMTLNVLLMTYY